VTGLIAARPASFTYDCLECVSINQAHALTMTAHYFRAHDTPLASVRTLKRSVVVCGPKGEHTPGVGPLPFVSNLCILVRSGCDGSHCRWFYDFSQGGVINQIWCTAFSGTLTFTGHDLNVQVAQQSAKNLLIKSQNARVSIFWVWDCCARTCCRIGSCRSRPPSSLPRYTRI